MFLIMICHLKLLIINFTICKMLKIDKNGNCHQNDTVKDDQ